MRVGILILFAVVIGIPRAASACECVATPFAIRPESKAVLAIGTVREIRPVDPDGWYAKAVLVEISEGLRNADKVKTMTFYTSAQVSACGYSFTAGRQYVIAATAVDDLSSAEIPSGVPPHSQLINRCGATRELDTPEGRKELADIREELKRVLER